MVRTNARNYLAHELLNVEFGLAPDRLHLKRNLPKASSHLFGGFFFDSDNTLSVVDGSLSFEQLGVTPSFIYNYG